MRPPEDETERLAAVATAHNQLVAATAALEAAISNARTGRPVTWAKIGAVLGVSAQGAHDRFTRKGTRVRRAG